MNNKFFRIAPLCACIMLTVLTVGCDDEDVKDPGENPNAVFAGQWTTNNFLKDGIWIIDHNGQAKSVFKRVNWSMSSPDIHRDSSYVELDHEFSMNLTPGTGALNIIQGDLVANAQIVSLEDKRITFEYPATGETVVMKKNGEYCTTAPADITDFYMSANRFKLHGMLFRSNQRALQFFYYFEVVDDEISEYTYTPGEGNSAHLSYHVKYRINPEKVRIETGVKNYKTDVTFDITGELDLTFLTHEEEGKNTSECYIGEMDGEVTGVVTNNVTGKKTTNIVTGKRLFSLTKVDEDDL